jgi:hypothetical protein
VGTADVHTDNHSDLGTKATSPGTFQKLVMKMRGYEPFWIPEHSRDHIMLRSCCLIESIPRGSCRHGSRFGPLTPELLVYPATDGLLLSSQPFLGLRDVTSDLLAGWPNVIQDASQREAPVAGRFGIDLGQPDAARGVLVVVVAASADVVCLI